MIIFSSKKLERAIAHDRLPNWERAKYIILPTIIMMLAPGPIYIARPIYGVKAPFLNSIFSFVCTIIGAFVTFYGIKRCFRTNEVTDKKDFLARFTILNVPIMFKFIAILIPITFISMAIWASLRSNYPSIFKRAPVSLSIIGPFVIYLYYSLLNRSFSRLRELIQQLNRAAPATHSS